MLNTGMSSDAVKKKLADLSARADTHDRAVVQTKAKYGDSSLVSDYVKKWDAFKAELSDVRERSDAWTGIVLEQEADNVTTRFGILLTEFSILATKLTIEKGAKKVEILEELVNDSKAPNARTDHQVVLKTDALPVPPIPAWVQDKENYDPVATTKKIGLGLFGVGGILGFLFLLRKLFGG